jgi:hypothetical protein
MLTEDIFIPELDQSVIFSSNFLINGTITSEIGNATAKAIPNALSQMIKKFGCHPTLIRVRTKDIINDIIIETIEANNSP